MDSAANPADSAADPAGGSSAGKRKKRAEPTKENQDAPPMSVDEARSIAQSEGLELLLSHTGTTGFRGVIDYKGSTTHPFIARLKVGGKHQHLGLFQTAAEAALAYARKVGEQVCKAAAEKIQVRGPAHGGATPTSLEDARRLAEEEGLWLVTSDDARSGYAGVVYHAYKPPAAKQEVKLVDSSDDEARAQASDGEPLHAAEPAATAASAGASEMVERRGRYMVTLHQVHVGKFRTDFEAALAYARALGAEGCQKVKAAREQAERRKAAAEEEAKVKREAEAEAEAAAAAKSAAREKAKAEVKAKAAQTAPPDGAKGVRSGHKRGRGARSNSRLQTQEVKSVKAAASQAAKSGADLWVQCERCDKWRRLAVGHSHGRGATSSKHWFCELNPDPLHDDCCLPQEGEHPQCAQKETRNDDDGDNDDADDEGTGGVAADALDGEAVKVAAESDDDENQSAVSAEVAVAFVDSFASGDAAVAADAFTAAGSEAAEAAAAEATAEMVATDDAHDAAMGRAPGMPGVSADGRRQVQTVVRFDPGMLDASGTRYLDARGTRSQKPAKRSRRDEETYLEAGQAHATGVGADHQAEVPKGLAPPLLPPPAAPPSCGCGRACVWAHSMWLCAEVGAEGCGFHSQVLPDPAPPTPLCRCATPCKWLLGRWWCAGYPTHGCGFEVQPEARAAPTRLSSAMLAKQQAASSAAMLTASAYGLSAWAFVAPTDCGLGLFARSPLVAGQYVVEYDGPRLPLESISRGDCVLEVPGELPRIRSPRRVLVASIGARADLGVFVVPDCARTGEGVAIDGAYENDAAGGPAGFVPSPAVFANHSKRPNAKLQYWPASSAALEAGSASEQEPHSRPSRLILVALEAVEAGCELRFDYECGGRRGQYWGVGVRPCVPKETNWRARPPLLPPPPSALEPVIGRPPPRPGVPLGTESHVMAEDEEAVMTEAPFAPPSAQPAWCGTESARLRKLVARLEQTAWLTECIQKGTATVQLWGLVATHFSGRSASECRDRYRQVRRTTMPEMQTGGAGTSAEAVRSCTVPRAKAAVCDVATFDLGDEGRVAALGEDSWGLVGTDASIPNELWGSDDGDATRCRIAAFIGKHRYARGGAAPSYVITDTASGYHYAVKASFLARHLDDPADRRRLAKAAPPWVTS